MSQPAERGTRLPSYHHKRHYLSLEKTVRAFVGIPFSARNERGHGQSRAGHPGLIPQFPSNDIYFNILGVCPMRELSWAALGQDRIKWGGMVWILECCSVLTSSPEFYLRSARRASAEALPGMHLSRMRRDAHRRPGCR